MHRTFRQMAEYCCGPRLILATAVASFAMQAGDGYKARYYYLSMSSLPRAIEHTGFMKMLFKPDGEKTLYTHSNLTGQKPTSDAELVHFSFGGQAPVEVHPIVNRAAYLGHKQRIGAQFVSPLRETAADKTKTTAANRPTSSQAGAKPHNRFG